MIKATRMNKDGEVTWLLTMNDYDALTICREVIARALTTVNREQEMAQAERVMSMVMNADSEQVPPVVKKYLEGIKTSGHPSGELVFEVCRLAAIGAEELREQMEKDPSLAEMRDGVKAIMWSAEKANEQISVERAYRLWQELPESERGLVLSAYRMENGKDEV